MLYTTEKITVPADGDYIATIPGGWQVGIVVDGQPDPAPIESTLPDASGQLHRRDLVGLWTEQQVRAAPPGLQLRLGRVVGPGAA
ncbi:MULTISPECIES: hypothetical protein [unclassified Micromonospora]|uniref:hypothetical protein n=1 Tax=unclassified Micromonospora TaxID=2617518 RepID=UPI002FF11226